MAEPRFALDRRRTAPWPSNQYTRVETQSVGVQVGDAVTQCARDIGMSEEALARVFRVRRLYVRLCLSLALLFGALSQMPERVVASPFREILLWLGIILFVATFPLYERYANRCPRCRRSFSDSSKYGAGEETSGLPLFSSIPKCPFCRVALHPAKPPKRGPR